MTRIEHLMTPQPVTIRPDTTVGEASKIMATCGLRHLPIVDGGGHLLGIISDRDLRGPLSGMPPSGGIWPLPSDEVRGYMSRDLVTAEPAEELGAVARRLVDRRVGAVPIVDTSGELRGIVSYVDVLRRLADDADSDARAMALLDTI